MFKGTQEDLGVRECHTVSSGRKRSEIHNIEWAVVVELLPEMCPERISGRKPKP